MPICGDNGEGVYWQRSKNDGEISCCESRSYEQQQIKILESIIKELRKGRLIAETEFSREDGEFKYSIILEVPTGN